MFPSQKIKYANYASSATFLKGAKIMLVFPNYAKNYASTIGKGLLQRYWLFTKILCYLLFSIGIVIGQFSSKWPGPSSRTVKDHSVVFLVEGKKFKLLDLPSRTSSLLSVLLRTRSAQLLSSQHFAAVLPPNIVELVPSVFFSVHSHGFCGGSNTFSQKCSCR